MITIFCQCYDPNLAKNHQNLVQKTVIFFARFFGENIFLNFNIGFAGLVRSNPMLTAVQISSRVAVLWAVVHKIDLVQVATRSWFNVRIFNYIYFCHISPKIGNNLLSYFSSS
jgi:hypothetical protein